MNPVLKIPGLVILFILLIPFYASAEEPPTAPIPSRQTVVCDEATNAKLACKRYGTLVKMWECGEDDYKVTDQSLKHASESACYLYLKLKPELDLKQQLLKEIREESSQQKVLKDKLRKEYLEQITK
ncbi:MAG: hypothetical protein OEX03_03315 [Gammaproteobacteria bacterium]|nr:hypothetical protein [Gammaproteobacteria bacterium]